MRHVVVVPPMQEVLLRILAQRWMAAAPTPSRILRRRRNVQESLVDPVPNKAALQVVAALPNRSPKLVQAPIAVAHRMRVLACDHRSPLLGRLYGLLVRPSHELVGSSVHRANDVGRARAA
eukprot:PRCOL_00006396-RA